MADSSTSVRAGSTIKVGMVVLLGTAYISASSLLIRFNKHLVQPGLFPYPMALSMVHMCCSFSCCALLYLVRPSAFPGMEAAEGRRLELLRWFAPIGLLFAVSLYTSNTAYLYASVTFLQFMKEANIIISFLISVAVGLQVMSRVRLATIIWIVAFSAATVAGELNFVWLGFALQLVSQLAECSRIVLGECVLSGSNFSLDPLTYTLFAAPTCLAFLLVGNIFNWSDQIVPRAMQLWHLLLPNASLAFILNLLQAALIKEFTAVGYTLVGVTKDILLVVVSAVLFGEVVTSGQTVCFSLVLTGILFWSLMKAVPDHRIVRWVEERMGLPRPEETRPLTKGLPAPARMGDASTRPS